MKFKKHGETAGKETAKKEFDAILTELRKYGETNKERGYSSYHKIDLTREQALEFIQFLKGAGYLKGNVNKDSFGFQTIRYTKVLQSHTKRLNHDYACVIQRYREHDIYTVGFGYKGIYPKSRKRTLKAEHTPYMFMW